MLKHYGCGVAGRDFPASYIQHELFQSSLEGAMKDIISKDLLLPITNNLYIMSRL